MEREQPIVVCGFGWGKVFRLYQNSHEIAGKYYTLTDLTEFRPIYRQALGISSARLELRFGKKKLVLRGIAAIEELQQVIAYLSSYISSEMPSYKEQTDWGRAVEFAQQYAMPEPQQESV